MSDDEKQLLCEQVVAEAYAAGSGQLSSKLHRLAHLKSDMSLVRYDSAKAAAAQDEPAQSSRPIVYSDTIDNTTREGAVKLEVFDNNDQHEVKSLKFMIVDLNMKLRSKEASESQAAQLKLLVLQQDASSKALHQSLDSSRSRCSCMCKKIAIRWANYRSRMTNSVPCWGGPHRPVDHGDRIT